jgi:hypothetical protein
MKNLEVIFEQKKTSDSKHILNTSHKFVPESILTQIESGLTIEQLEEIAKMYPIYKYRTQITIHGQFAELSNNWIHSYKHVFQNKNKSIGVKYGAIDECKRQKIAKRLKAIDFHYSRNSTDNSFYLDLKLTEENIFAIKQLIEKTDESLFYGKRYAYKYDIWGEKRLRYEIHIGAIYEKNIETFLNKLGATEHVYSEMIKEQERERAESEKYWAEKKAEEQIKIEQARTKIADQIEKLKAYTKVEKTQEPGIYVGTKYRSMDDTMMFEAIYIYMPAKKKKPRFRKDVFYSLDEILSNDFQPKFNDSILSGRITGYKVK